MLFAGLGIPGRSQVLSIYLNTDDCLNCTSAIAWLPALDTAISVVIQADRDKERFTPAVLQKFGVQLSGRTSLHYIRTRDLERVASRGSVCRFVVEGRCILAFALKDLAERIDLINSLARDYTRTVHMRVEPELVLSDRVSYYMAGDRVVLCDYLTGRTHYGAVAGGEVITREFHFPVSFTTDYFLGIGKDTARYRKHRPLLQAQAMDRPVVIGANASGDTLQLLVDLRYPDDAPGTDSAVWIQTYPVFLSLLNDTVISWWRCDWMLPGSADPYLITIHDGFCLLPDRAVIPVFSKTPGDGPEELLAEFELVERSIRFRRFLGVITPTEVEQNGPKDKSYSAHIHGTLWMMRCFPLFHDLVRNTTYDLSRAIAGTNRHKYFKGRVGRYWTWDAQWVSASVLQVLYYDGSREQQMVAWVDTEEDRVLRTVRLNARGMIDESLQLLSNGSVIGLSEAHDAIVLLR